MGIRSPRSTTTHPLSRLFGAHPAAVTLALVVILTAASYGGSLRNGFVWDDETLVVNNRYVHDLARWPRYFLDADSISSDPLVAKTYRPLQTVSFALDQALWRGQPGGFHLTSLLIHVAVCLAVFFLFTPVVGPGPSSVAAVLFAVHPALSEGVLCLASRGGQLAALLGLLACGLFLRVQKPFDARHVLAVLATALALLSKEPAIALVALLPLLQAALGRPWLFLSRRTWMLHAPFAVVALLYLALRHRIVGSMIVGPYWGGSLVATLQMQAKVFTTYLRLLVWPFHLQGRYSIAPPGAFPDVAAIAAVLLNLVLLLPAVATLVFRVRNSPTFSGRGIPAGGVAPPSNRSTILGRRALPAGGRAPEDLSPNFGLGTLRTEPPRLFSLAVIWFYVSLLPVSNLIPIPGSMLGERFIYFTFAGMFPLLVGAAAKLFSRIHPRVLLASTAIVVAGFVARDIARTAVWKDNATYFRLLVQQEPNDPIVQIGMAGEEIKAGTPERAVRRLERFLGAKGTPEGQGKLRYWYGLALLRTGRAADAYRQFRIVEALTGVTTDLALSLAEAAAGSGDLGAARRILDRAIEAAATNDALWNALGNVAWLSGDLRSAAAHYRKALKINPSNREAAINLKKVRHRLSSSGR